MRPALAAVALVAAFAAASAPPAYAASPQDPVLYLFTLSSLPLGAHPNPTVSLRADGVALADQPIDLLLDGRVTRRVRTGRFGVATGEIARDLPAGEHTLAASFPGASGLRAAVSTSARFTVRTAELRIATIPAVAGLPLVAIGDGEPLVTGPDGVARATMTEVGRVTVRPVLPSADATRRIRFVRWGDRPAGAERTIRVPDTLDLQVGMELSYPVRLTFTDPDDNRINPARVTRVETVDSSGRAKALDGTRLHWLPANRITRPVTGLVSTPVEYRVTEISLRGENVVNQSQQQFVADRTTDVTIELLVFSLAIESRDAILKTPTGSAARLIYPDLTEEMVPLDTEGTAIIHGLPRGDYRLSLTGAAGFALQTPVALSRNQTAELLLISTVDLVLVGGAGISVALGLLLIGRPHLTGLLRRRREPAVEQAPS